MVGWETRARSGEAVERNFPRTSTTSVIATATVDGRSRDALPQFAAGWPSWNAASSYSPLELISPRAIQASRDCVSLSPTEVTVGVVSRKQDTRQSMFTRDSCSDPAVGRFEEVRR